MRIEFISLLTLALGTAGASTLGVSKLWKSNAREMARKSCREYGSFYSKIGTTFDVRRYGLYQVDLKSPAAYHTLQTSFAGLSLLPSIGWDRLARFEVSVQAGGGPEQGSIRNTMYLHRTSYFDSDLKFVLLAPMLKRVQMGFTFGWEYMYHNVGTMLTTGEYQTDSMTYLNGAITGLRIEAQPSGRWSMCMGIEYHLPSAKAKVRSNYNQPFVERRLHGGRYGLTSFASVDYQMTKHWAFQMAFNATDLEAKGDKKASSTGYETGVDTFNFQYTQYSFGFNCRF